MFRKSRRSCRHHLTSLSRQNLCCERPDINEACYNHEFYLLVSPLGFIRGLIRVHRQKCFCGKIARNAQPVSLVKGMADIDNSELLIALTLKN